MGKTWAIIESEFKSFYCILSQYIMVSKFITQVQGPLGSNFFVFGFTNCIVECSLISNNLFTTQEVLVISSVKRTGPEITSSNAIIGNFYPTVKCNNNNILNEKDSERHIQEEQNPVQKLVLFNVDYSKTDNFRPLMNQPWSQCHIFQSIIATQC